MTTHVPVLLCSCLALGACQPDESTSGPASQEEESEVRSGTETARVIDGLEMAVVGVGDDARLVEWPSMKPIPADQMKAIREWGFLIAGTEHGSRIFEWPSMAPIRVPENMPDGIDGEGFPPLPDSRWSK